MNAEEQEGDDVDADEVVDVNNSAATVVANRTVVEHVIVLRLCFFLQCLVLKLCMLLMLRFMFLFLCVFMAVFSILNSVMLIEALIATYDSCEVLSSSYGDYDYILF